MSAERYEGATGTWWITYDPPPIPIRSHDYQFWHDDYDGAPDSGDTRCGSAPSVGEARSMIREYEEQHDQPGR